MPKPVGYRDGSDYARLHDAAVDVVTALVPNYSGDIPDGLSALAEVLRMPASSVLRYCLLLSLMKVEKLGK
jgi:hypothetical protein